MPSQATEVYRKLRDDLDTLLGYHPGIESPGPGRPPGDTGPLLRASIVLLVTAWENYVEQAVLEALDHVMPLVSADRTLLAPHLQGVVGAAAKNDPWTVTGEGWLRLADQEARELVAGLNNASSGQVEGLLAKTLAVTGIFDGISWQNRMPASVRQELVDLVDVRGEIVHKGRAYSSLTLGGVRSWRDFVDRVIPKFDAKLAVKVAARYGNGPPW